MKNRDKKPSRMLRKREPQQHYFLELEQPEIRATFGAYKARIPQQFLSQDYVKRHPESVSPTRVEWDNQSDGDEPEPELRADAAAAAAAEDATADEEDEDAALGQGAAKKKSKGGAKKKRKTTSKGAGANPGKKKRKAAQGKSKNVDQDGPVENNFDDESVTGSSGAVMDKEALIEAGFGAGPKDDATYYAEARLRHKATEREHEALRRGIPPPAN